MIDARGSVDAVLRANRQSGLVLVVVLMIITLLAMVGASFSYLMNADFTAMSAVQQQQQARFAAESGIDRVILLLQSDRLDVDQWYNNSDDLRRMLIWSPERVGGAESLAAQEKIEGQPAWRASVVAYEVDDNNSAKIRYGLTDEPSKINLNTATREQLLNLFDQIKPEKITSEELADALMDWRDADDEPVSQSGAESSYYRTLTPSYQAKNGGLDTVEELLMVRGFTGRILYGEDYNRNGYLDPNEDDGEEGQFPPDNGDGILDRGLLPYVTVYSWDFNTSLDNKRRVDINTVKFSQASSLPTYLQQELSSEVIEFIAEAQQRKYKFKSVGDLLNLEVYEDGTSNHDAIWKAYNKERKAANTNGLQIAVSTDQQSESNATDDDSSSDQSSSSSRRRGRSSSRDRDNSDTDDGADAGENSGRDSSGDADTDEETSESKSNRRRLKGADDSDSADSAADEESEADSEHRSVADQIRDQQSADGDTQDDDDEDESGQGKEGSKGTPVESPVTAEMMPVLMDRLSVAAVTQPVVPGLINVNTASPQVLKTIPGITERDVESIVGRRTQMTGTDKENLAWLVTGGALSTEQFMILCNQLTTRSLQFSMDVIGFADHVGAIKRIQAVVELKGNVAQLKYYRDITSLGIGYPVFDDQRSQGFAFSK